MTAHRTPQLPAPRRLPRTGRGGAARPVRGFIMGYILFALVVLGIVVAALGRMNDQQSEAKYVEDSLTRLKDNVQSIRVQIMTCSALISDDQGPGLQFPTLTDPAKGNTLANVSCPMGSQPAVQLFDGSSGVFLPQPPSGFSAYTYFNDYAGSDPAVDDGVYVETTVTSSPLGTAAINRLTRTYSPDEMTVSQSGATTTLRYYLAR